MSDQSNKEIVQKYVEKVWNGESLGSFESIVSEDFRYYLGSNPGMDKNTMIAFINSVHTAFPDWNVEIETIAEENEVVFIQWTGKATHQGIFHGIAPTKKEVYVTGINLYKLKSGLIIEEREQMDSLGLLQQIGALPAQN